MTNTILKSNFLFAALSCLLWFVIVPNQAAAHAPGENYVWVNVDQNGISGRFEIHVDDLKRKLNIDLETQSIDDSAEAVQEYLVKHFELLIDGKSIEIEFGETGLFVENAEYAQYYYTTKPMDVPDQFSIRNDIFITPDDPLHRSLIVLEYNKKIDSEYGGENAIMAFGPHNDVQELDLTDLPSLLNPKQFIWQGVLHIWIGLDHILFLLALLLMAVMVVNRPVPVGDSEAMIDKPEIALIDGEKVDSEKVDLDAAVTSEVMTLTPVSTFAGAFWNVFKIVTIFTIAHSITLSLAALGLINVNSQLIESLIALSIVIVAINNIFPKFNDKRWLIIFFFGLFHGMGFASVMGVLPFRTISLMKVLIAFNVGVELGQLAIVAGVFPVIYLLRKTKFYRYVILVGGSAVIAAIAIYWFFERALGL